MSQLKSAYYRAVASLWNSGLSLARRDRDNSVSIVYLHGVHTPEMAAVAPPPTSSVSVASFESNVRGLQRHYRVISLSDAVGMLTGRLAWRSQCAVLTFDDSLKCIADVALPTLRKLGATATLFLSTAAIETTKPYWWLRLDYVWHKSKGRRASFHLTDGGTRETFDGNDIRSLIRVKSALRKSPSDVRDRAVASIETEVGVALSQPSSQYPHASSLTWEDARKALEWGFEVGSHTVSHPNLTLLSADSVARELAESKEQIERHLSIRCRHLSYPYGAYNDSVARIAERCGYDAAVSTMSPGHNTSRSNAFALSRYGVPAAAEKLPYVMAGIRNV